MLTLCGCEITTANADQLIEALTDAGTHASVEAAAAIRWGIATHANVDDLEPELCRAILDALDDAAPDLSGLRDALTSASPPVSRRARTVHWLHNPRGRACGCLDDCWCKRTVWGRAIRWYIPQKRHTSVSPCWKHAQREIV